MAKEIFSKKDTSVQVRMPSELKNDLLNISKAYNDTPAGLTRFLAERFVEAHKKMGSKLLYPPEFKIK